jgi:biopolymer transport protein ExbD
VEIKRENMKYLVSFIKIVSIRAVSFALTFSFGLFVCSLTVIHVEKAELYILKAEIFYRDKACTRPNPNVLLVETDENRIIKLNWENLGSIDDTSLLEKRLRDVFQYRCENEIFNRDFTQIEKTVFIQPNESTRYGDLVKLIEALNKAGANPVYLDPNNENCGGGGGA